MRTALICHHDAPLDREGLARWLASFSDLVGIVEIREAPEAKRRRAAREYRRSGTAGFLDVLAFRAWYRLFLAANDARWERRELERLRQLYPDPPAPPGVCAVSNPNAPEARAFLDEHAPDLVIARCKFLLKPEVFGIPRRGTFVMHPGICPRYRNAHGCFWALATGDTANVGMTLLQIDEGIDTGPVFGFYGYDYDELAESHVVIQHRTVHDNLEAVAARLCKIAVGTASTVDTDGQPSKLWGQPRLSAYLRWKRAAKKRRSGKP